MPQTAVIIPCYNEAVAIADVVKQAKSVLPDATVYVYDNESTDGSAEIARQAGALVRSVSERGKEIGRAHV